MIKTETEIKAEFDKLVSDETSTDEGGFVNLYDAERYANTGWDIDAVENWWLSKIDSLLHQDREELKKAIEGKKYTFKEVTWSIGITSIEPVEDETKCLEYAKGFNAGIDKAVSLLQSKHE